MVKFKQKSFSKFSKVVDTYKGLVVPTASLGLSGASLYIANKNMRTNQLARSESKESAQQQIGAMNRLSDSLNKVDRSLKTIPPQSSQPSHPSPESSAPKRGFWIFRKKEFSESLDNLINKTIQGAGIGSGVGVGIGSLISKTPGKFFGTAEFKNTLKTVGISTAIGAGLGFLVGAIQNIVNKIENKPNPRLLNDIEANLKQAGLVKNTDYVLDPKYADLLKTRVSVVISKSSGDLKLAVNTFNDPKLDKATRDIIKGLPKSAIITEKFGNKFNDLSISTISSGRETDAAFISNIIGEFVSHKFPVYIVEVG